MKLSFSLLSLSLLAVTLAHPSNITPSHALLQRRCPSFDPAGVKNVGNNAGTQFIGGQCLSNRDCASNCCATCAGAGICSGPGASTQNGKEGCGFGGGSGSGNAATPAPGVGSNGAVPAVPSAAPDVGRNGNGNGNTCKTN